MLYKTKNTVDKATCKLYLGLVEPRRFSLGLIGEQMGFNCVPLVKIGVHRDLPWKVPKIWEFTTAIPRELKLGR